MSIYSFQNALAQMYALHRLSLEKRTLRKKPARGPPPLFPDGLYRFIVYLSKKNSSEKDRQGERDVFFKKKNGSESEMFFIPIPILIYILIYIYIYISSSFCTLCTRPLTFCTRPLTFCARLFTFCTRPLTFCARLFTFCTRPLTFCARLFTFCTRPLTFCARSVFRVRSFVRFFFGKGGKKTGGHELLAHGRPFRPDVEVFFWGDQQSPFRWCGSSRHPLKRKMKVYICGSSKEKEHA